MNEIISYIIKAVDFNTVCGISSIIGLFMSVYVAMRTTSIQKTVSKSLVNERFRVNYNTIMDDLKSTGMNAVREDFPDIQLIFEFESKLRSYQKNYNDILTDEEKSDIDELLILIQGKSIPRDKFFHQLSKIVSKHPVNEEG